MQASLDCSWHMLIHVTGCICMLPPRVYSVLQCAITQQIGVQVFMRIGLLPSGRVKRKRKASKQAGIAPRRSMTARIQVWYPHSIQ